MKQNFKNITMIAFALLSTLAMQQCSEPEPKPVDFSTSFSTADLFLNSRAPQKETFTLNLTSSQTITSANGWKYTFMPNTFRAKISGNFINNNIQVEITEYNSKADMIYSGVTTTSNTSILESGGMFKITASSGGSELEMSGSYEVLIPTDDPVDDMRIFRGNEQITQDSTPTVNWVIPPDSSQGDSSFVPTDSSRKYYVLNMTFLSWCNLDRYFNAPTGDPVRLKIPSEYLNYRTTVYMIFDGSSVVNLFRNVDNSEYNSGSYNLPSGWDIKLLVISIKDDELYYGLVDSQTGPNHLEELTSLTLITEEDLDELIEGF